MKDKIKVITDAISGCLVLLSVLIYIILGLAIQWWHPGWIIIIATVVLVSIMSIIANAYVDTHKEQKEKEKK